MPQSALSLALYASGMHNIPFTHTTAEPNAREYTISNVEFTMGCNLGGYAHERPYVHPKQCSHDNRPIANELHDAFELLKDLLPN